MRKVFLVVSLFCCFLSFSQDNNDGYNKIFTVLDKLPEPPGGLQVFRTYIATSFKIPEHLPEGFVGRIVTRFVVDNKGKIKDVTIISSNDESLSKEAIRVLLKSKRWKPGELDGKK